MNTGPRFPVGAAFALHGRIFAMLSVDELEVPAFYRQHSRKFGVDAHIGSTAQADETMRGSNSLIA